MAYDRTNARLKIPPGRRDASLRSRASSAATVIFVAFAIWRSDMPRRSRASRSLLPKSPGVRSTAIWETAPAAGRDWLLRYVNPTWSFRPRPWTADVDLVKASPERRRARSEVPVLAEQADRRYPGRATLRDGLDTIGRHAANRQHG